VYLQLILQVELQEDQVEDLVEEVVLFNQQAQETHLQ
jgi:hypothetical protein